MSKRPKRSGGLVMLLLGATLPGCAPDPGVSLPSQALTSAPTATLETSGRWAEAAELHRAEALRLGPERWDGAVKKALVDYLMANDLTAAEKLTADCLARSPSSVEVLYYLGDSQRVMMSYPEAGDTLARLLRERPGHLRGMFSLAHVHARLGKPAEALPLLERFLGDPGAPEELRSLAGVECARVLKRLGRPAEAAGRLAQVLEAAPYNTIALAEAAQVLSILGRAELAQGLKIQHAWLFERGHQVSVEDETKLYPTGPTSEGAELRLALQAADRREFLDALSKLESLAASLPGDDGIAASLGRLWLRLFRYHEALRVVEAARAKGAISPDLLRIEADAETGLGRPEESLAALIRASEALDANRREESPEGVSTSLEIHLRLALAALDPGRDLETARAAIARAARLAPDDWRSRYGAARIQIEGGELKLALESLAAASRRAPAEGRASLELRRWAGVARGLAGDLRTAAREIMATVKEAPGEIDGFKAFERVFGAKTSEPEVVQVLELKRALETKLLALEAARKAAAEAPFRSSSAQLVALGGLLASQGFQDKAVDAYLLSAQLDPRSGDGLRRAATILTAPRDTFTRLWALHALSLRFPADSAAAQALARARADLGLASPEDSTGK